MAFNTTSFLAGVGTVFAAVMLGFAGGAMITTSPKVEPNRVERVAGSAPVVSAKTETQASPAVPAASVSPAKPATAETAAGPDRVISLPPKPDSPQAVPSQLVAQPQPVSPQPQPVMAKDDAGAQADNAKKVRDPELKKEAELKKAQRRAEARRERRKQQEIQAAANAVRQLRADGGLRDVSQEVVTSREVSPRFGFFGDN